MRQGVRPCPLQEAADHEREGDRGQREVLGRVPDHRLPRGESPVREVAPDAVELPEPFDESRQASGVDRKPRRMSEGPWKCAARPKARGYVSAAQLGTRRPERRREGDDGSAASSGETNRNCFPCAPKVAVTILRADCESQRQARSVRPVLPASRLKHAGLSSFYEEPRSVYRTSPQPSAEPLFGLPRFVVL